VLSSQRSQSQITECYSSSTSVSWRVGAAAGVGMRGSCRVLTVEVGASHGTLLSPLSPLSFTRADTRKKLPIIAEQFFGTLVTKIHNTKNLLSDF
jgi:hypothetical protein